MTGHTVGGPKTLLVDDDKSVIEALTDLLLVPCARPYAYHTDVLGRLIGEVYANVSRHAPSGGKYEVSVLVKTIPWKSLK